MSKELYKCIYTVQLTCKFTIRNGLNASILDACHVQVNKYVQYDLLLEVFPLFEL